MSGGADWSLPTTSTGYLLVPGDLNDKDVDAITLQKTAPSNLPDGAIAWDRGALKFKEWSSGGSAFVDMVLSIAGGGTGAASASAARTSLGLGTMAVQNANAVAITGGSISGVTMDASVLTSGQVALARGGTGASLAIGANGSFLQSNGAAVLFGTDGSQLINLNGSQITAGTVSRSRLPPIAYTALTKATNYVVTTTDINNKTVILANGSITLTLPAANDGGITTPPFGLRIVLLGAFTVTITPSAGTIIGAASFILNFGAFSSMEVWPDGGNNDWKIF